jgi:cell division septation protein DedD
VATAALAFVGLAVLAAFRLVLTGPGKTPNTSRATLPPAAAAPTPTRIVHGGPVSDTLYYSVQVASFTSAAQALEAADRYEALDLIPTVSPVRLGRRGLWYRLILGAYPDPVAAETALRTAWDQRLLARSSGTILRTPQALEIGGYPTAAEARAKLPALRELGIAGYIVEAPDGNFHILVGAFESPEQAGTADSILTAAGLSSLLVTRTGMVR